MRLAELLRTDCGRTTDWYGAILRRESGRWPCEAAVEDLGSRVGPVRLPGGLLAGEHFADGAGVPGATTLGGRDSVANQTVRDGSERRTGIGLELATNGFAVRPSERLHGWATDGEVNEMAVYVLFRPTMRWLGWSSFGDMCLRSVYSH